MHKVLKFSLFFSLFLATFNISANIVDFKAVVEKLASAEMEGRKAGSLGNEKSVTFIEDIFKSLNLSVLESDLKEEFTIFTEMEKVGDNNLLISGQIEPLFQPISFSQTGNLDHLDLVFVGYGISIPKNDAKIIYDDYEGVDVKDKIVIVLTGDPGVKNPTSPFRDPDYVSYQSLHYKMKNAINHGAKGFILVSDPLSNTRYPEEEPPRFNGSEGGGDRFNILAGYATVQFIDSFLNKETLLSLQEKILKTNNPNSKELNLKASLSVSLKKKTGRVANVIGMIEGSDEVLKKEIIVIGAHLDHLGYGGESSLERFTESDSHLKFLMNKYQKARKAFFMGQGKIHFGADDNASGVAMALKLSEWIKRQNFKRSHLIVLFNAEEVGLLGSKAFVENFVTHEQKWGTIKGMLNYDMVGRYSENIAVMGTKTGIEWNSILSPIQSTSKFELKEDAVGSSDHASFINKKIPALFFTTGGHPDYHTSRDTADKIVYSGMDAIFDYSKELLVNLEQSPINYNIDYKDPGTDTRPRGYGAHLGCIPEFSQPDSVKGVICSGAVTDSPAEKAGVVAGDIITQIGDIEIQSVYDLAFALKYYRAGDEIELVFKHDQSIVKVKVILARSKRS